MEPNLSGERGGTTATTAIWRGIALVLLFALCCFTRLYNLGYKSIMHDETLFVYYTYYQLYEAWNYVYMPILHGPAALMWQALMFHIFGGSDFSMRLGVATAGIGSFWWIWAMRPWLKETGTWIALIFYTLSPGITQFQRFFHIDSTFVFQTLWLIVSLAYWWRTARGAWVASALVAASFLFTTKENSLFVYFSVVTFGVLLFLHEAFQTLATKGITLQRESGRTTPVWVPALVAFVAVLLVITQVFEGITYEKDVIDNIGHNWVLKDVLSVPLALGWFRLSEADAPDAGGLGSNQVWRVAYAFTALGFLGLFLGVHLLLRFQTGKRRALPYFADLVSGSRYYLLGGIAAAAGLYVWIFTTGLTNRLGFFQIYANTWAYWGGQHEWGRIGGPFHQHPLNILLYEFPSVLIVVSCWIWGSISLRWTRVQAVSLLLFAVPVAAFHHLLFSKLEAVNTVTQVMGPMNLNYLKLIFFVTVVTGVAVLAVPRWGRILFPIGAVALLVFSVAYFTSDFWLEALRQPVYRAGEAIRLSNRHVTLLDMMEIQFNFDGGDSIAFVLILTLFASVFTWAELGKGRLFHAFLIWWTVTSIGAAAYAREAVPQVGIHAMLPLILLAASYSQLIWERLRGSGRRWFTALLIVLALWNTKNQFMLIFRYPDDVRERMVYGHTSQDIRNHCLFVTKYQAIAGLRIGANGVPTWITSNNSPNQFKDVKVGVATDLVVWPVRWYLRDVDWTENKDVKKMIDDKYQFLFTEPNALDKFPDLAKNYHTFRGSGLRFWLPRPLSSERLIDIWKMLIPGHYLDATPQAIQAYNATKEWGKVIDYVVYRQTFDGEVDDDANDGTLQGSDYLFCVRRDLY